MTLTEKNIALEKQLQELVKDIAEMREVIVGLANQLYALTHSETNNDPR